MTFYCENSAADVTDNGIGDGERSIKGRGGRFWQPIVSNNVFFNVLLASLPVCLLLWVPGIWVVFFSIIVLYYNGIYKNRVGKKALTALYALGVYRDLGVIFGSYFFLSICSIVFLNSPLKSIDNPLVFSAWLLLSPIIVLLKPNTQIVGYGCFVAVNIALVMALIQFHFLNEPRAYGLYGYGVDGSGAIKFADIALLFGMLTCILLSDSKAKFFGRLGLVFGLIVCLYAASRGTLVAFFLCGIVWWLFDVQRLSLRRVAITLMVLALAIFALNMLMNNALVTRVSETSMDVYSVFNNQLDTSMGIRIQLWLAAVILFTQHPGFGVGLNNFEDAILVLNQQHILSDAAVRYAHAHNEYLCALATGGIVGFSVTLLLFLVPLKVFKADYNANLWAKAGFWTICLMSFFALTDCIFDRRMSVMAFIIVISICLAGNITQKKLKEV